jgi:hypothetical protein
MSFCSVLSTGAAAFGIAGLVFGESGCALPQIYCPAALAVWLLLALTDVVNTTAAWKVTLCIEWTHLHLLSGALHEAK